MFSDVFIFQGINEELLVAEVAIFFSVSARKAVGISLKLAFNIHILVF